MYNAQTEKKIPKNEKSIQVYTFNTFLSYSLICSPSSLLPSINPPPKPLYPLPTPLREEPVDDVWEKDHESVY